MAYAITDACIKDALCVEACPVNCIHPEATAADFEAVTQLYVDPENCIDCGACAPVCTSNAILSIDQLPSQLVHFAEVNAKYFQ